MLVDVLAGRRVGGGLDLPVITTVGGDGERTVSEVNLVCGSLKQRLSEYDDIDNVVDRVLTTILDMSE